MSAELTLEQSEARRMAAEAEATSLKAELAAAEERAKMAQANAAMQSSVQQGADLAALRRDLGQLRQRQDESENRAGRTYGETGVDTNGEVIRGNRGPSNEGDGEQLPSKLTYFVEAGITRLYRVYMRRA